MQFCVAIIFKMIESVTSMYTLHKRSHSQLHKRSHSQLHKRSHSQLHKRSHSQLHKRSHSQLHTDIPQVWLACMYQKRDWRTWERERESSISIHTSIYISTYAYKPLHKYFYTRAQTGTYIHTNALSHTLARTRTWAHVQMCVCMDVSTHVWKRI